MDGSETAEAWLWCVGNSARKYIRDDNLQKELELCQFPFVGEWAEARQQYCSEAVYR
jgi:hypothetical protein